MSEYTAVEYNPLSYAKDDSGLFLSKPRSSGWRKKRLEHLEKNPSCAICGLNTELEVHHIKPFEYWPELEEVDENLVTLCMNEKRNCHIIWGHLFDWKLFNPEILHLISLLKKRKTFSKRDDNLFLT